MLLSLSHNDDINLNSVEIYIQIQILTHTYRNTFLFIYLFCVICSVMNKNIRRLDQFIYYLMLHGSSQV